MKKKRFRRCKHERVVVFSYREKMHKCRECDLVDYMKEKYKTEGKEHRKTFREYFRDRWGHSPRPCSWELCGKTIVYKGIYFAKCSECGASSKYSTTPVGAMQAFALMARK